MTASAAGAGSLRLRILSALVLAPLALAAIWLGSPYLQILTVVAAMIMAWEWSRLCGGGFALIGVVAMAVIAAAMAQIAVACVIAILGALAVSGVEAQRPGGTPLWMAAGAFWVALPCAIFLWLATNPSAGRATLVWVFAVVWATDIGAYAIGRALGGPLLAPRWSPRKTWTGLAGGVACAGLAGLGTAEVAGAGSVAPLVLTSAGLAIVEQFGDLAESVAKRRFGVKDASSLIPGHGGLLDRLDGFLAVIPAVALLILISGGSVLTWR